MTTPTSWYSPLKSNHAILEMALVFSPTGQFPIRPNSEELFSKDDELKQKFDVFKWIDHVSVNLTLNQGKISNSQNNNYKGGFNLMKYEAGKLAYAVRVISEPSPSFSIHYLEYPGWREIQKNIFPILATLVDKLDIRINFTNWSLNYIDYFHVDSQKLFNMGNHELWSDFFNKDSSFIPQSVFDAAEFNVKSEFLRLQMKDGFYSERSHIEVRLLRDPMIRIEHQLIRADQYGTKDFLDPKLTSQLNELHHLNKKYLQDILKKEVCELINLEYSSDI